MTSSYVWHGYDYKVANMNMCDMTLATRLLHIGNSTCKVTPHIQGGEDSEDALSCKSIFAKEPLIIGLFCGTWPIKIRHPMTPRHPVWIYVWLLHIGGSIIICVTWFLRHDSFIFVTPICNMTPHIWINVWLLHFGDSYTWHDSFICVTWLLHKCDVTPHIWIYAGLLHIGDSIIKFVTWFLRHDSFMFVTPMCDKTPYIWINIWVTPS